MCSGLFALILTFDHSFLFFHRVLMANLLQHQTTKNFHAFLNLDWSRMRTAFHLQLWLNDSAKFRNLHLQT